MYAPGPRTSPTEPESPIRAWKFEPTDDGKMAVAEFVARDAGAFAAILADKTVKVFSKGKDKREDIEREVRKVKKDFDLDKFGLAVP
jgi:hypothetical protein